MKELQKVILTILLVCSSLVAMAAADPTMSVSEQPDGIAIGETFIAEVTVDPAGAEIYAVQYDLYFDHAILKATEQTQGTFLRQSGAITQDVVNTINNTTGKIEYAETRLGDPETVGGATATGVLASITFEVIGDGASTLTLGDVKYVTPDDLRDPEPEPTSDPNTSISEHPAGIAIGETFTAEVTMDPAGAEIYAVQYDLYFDHTILKAIRQTPGDFLSHGDAETYPVVNTVNNTIGKIEYAETRLGDVGGATATGILASITFEVIGAGISTLTLSDVKYVMPDDLIDPGIGDLNGDGVITSADVMIALQMAVRGEYDQLADVNGDDRVTSVDALMIQQVAVG